MDGKELTGVLQRYCETYAICAEAAQSLQNDLAALLASPAADEFLALVAGYPAPDWDYQAQLTAAGALSEKAGIHPYVMAFLYCVALLPAAEKLWLEAGFTRQNFLDAFADLSYKLTECKKMYGIYGSFVADWFGGWYVPARFALGRLQFELVPCHCLPGMEDGFTLHGVSYPADTQLINVHIPSSGHLPHDSVVDAYRRAAAFFRQHFADQLPKDSPSPLSA